ncbi:CDP-diacylglycerol--serine O-phosphatidyltransferase [Fusobacterium massiliense]|jgi:CDP-diacylglycerol-serine O-phosphatidyltransferase|uniref:CDP-diacylglycerol--serine O-phosphatidyltransferase n=1 Tax=Siphoviridae sp. ct6rT12 TaxID=2825346 RepID=A0A8S5V9J9_9CAUD|nr:CDP-diacylglycerol--serine O-phosphatidyltransferase [Fusobacterium massiliense]DAG03315.1 MAG TPA: Phosphatidylserine synthase [Siphoviridae sp. ct6rT12]
MVKKKYIAPNLITAGNMFLGYLSITESIKGNFNTAILFILLAMVCDGLDGKTARTLDAFSEFGKEFDSFSDAISFGLAPSMLIYSILSSKVPSSPFIVPVSFLYALCGVMRLVKFNIINIASSEKGDFSGMPIPNAAAMVVSYVMICNVVYEKFLINLFDIKVFIGISVISASLMVSTIPFKTPDKTFSFIPKKVALGLILALLITMYWTLDYSVFIISYLYVLLNIISYFNKRFLSNESDTSVDEFIEIEIDDEEKGE